MQYITAVFWWTGLAASFTVGVSQGKPSSGKSNAPAPSGVFPHDQSASLGSPAGGLHEQPNSSAFGFGAPAFPSAYGARAPGQAPAYGSSSAGFGGGLAGSQSSGFSSGAPAAFASSSGFSSSGSPVGYAMSSSGPGGALNGYSAEASNSGFAGALLASGSLLGGSPAGYASSGFGGAPVQSPINDGVGAASNGYGANLAGLSAYASSPNGMLTSSSEGFRARHPLTSRSTGQEKSASASAAGSASNGSAGVIGTNTGAGQYGYPSFASAGNPSLGGSAQGPDPLLGLNAPQGASPFVYASNGFASPPQTSFDSPRGYSQFESSQPQLSTGLGRFGSSPSGGEGLKHIFKPYHPQGSGPGSALSSAPGSSLAQRKADAKKPLGRSSISNTLATSSSSRFASSGKAIPEDASGKNVTGSMSYGGLLNLKNPSRSIRSIKKDLSRRKSRKSRKFPK